MSKKNSRKTRVEAHVRIYAYELESTAFRSLSPEARSLLVEMRALFKGQENRVFMSREEMKRRLGVGQHRANKARDELIDRGFIKVLAQGSFSQKTRMATEYALLNEPLDGEPTARKDYMAWPLKNTGVDEQPRRGRSVTPFNGQRVPDDPPQGRSDTPSKRFFACHGVDDRSTDKLPGGRG